MRNIAFLHAKNKPDKGSRGFELLLVLYTNSLRLGWEQVKGR